MPVARRFAAALAVVGAGVLAYALPASAHNSSTDTAACVDGTNSDNLQVAVSPTTGRATAQGWNPTADHNKGAPAPVCAPVTLLLSSYRAPETWDDKGFDASAVPQTSVPGGHTSGVLSGSGKLALDVPLVECGVGQIDLYYPPRITRVDAGGHGSQFIGGSLYRVTASCGKEAPPSSTPAPSPPSSPTSTPAPSPTSSPTSTPAPSPTSSPTSTPAPSPTSSPTTPAEIVPIVIVVVTPSTPARAPAAVPPAAPPSPAPAAQLAQTGSNSTLPLVGLGAVLLLGGAGLLVLGRRRRSI